MSVLVPMEFVPLDSCRVPIVPRLLLAGWKEIAALALACAALVAVCKVFPVPVAVAVDVNPPLVRLPMVLMPVCIVADNIGICPPYVNRPIMPTAVFSPLPRM